MASTIHSMNKILVALKICLPLRRRLVYVRAAGPLTVTILSIAISNIFHLYQAPHNIKTVGVVPAVSGFTQLGPPMQADALLVTKYYPSSAPVLSPKAPCALPRGGIICKNGLATPCINLHF